MNIRSMQVAAFVLGASMALRGFGQMDQDFDHDTSVPGSKPVFTIHLENDTVADTDWYYTNGMKFSWFTADLVEWGQTGWRKAFVEALPFVNHPGAQKNLGFALGQNIYTPRDTERVPPDPNDRPYAGWSYLEFSFASRTSRVSDTLVIQLGIVGPHSYADRVHEWVHEQLGSRPARGWDYQLHDEVGVNVIYERRIALLAQMSEHGLDYDVVPHLGFSVGNVHTYANAGATVRLGYNLPSDFGVDLIRAGSNGQAPVVNGTDLPRRPFSVFVFGGVNGRAVARDLFLDGNTFEDSPSVDRENVVADLHLGVGLVVGNWQFTFTRVERTREFHGQEQNSRFGSATVSVAW